MDESQEQPDATRLLRFAYLLCRDRGHAEDLVQEALLKLHRHRGRSIGAPEAYARRVVVNEYLGWKRRAWTREIVTEAPTAEVGAAPGSPRHLRIDDVLAAIDRLTPRQRAVIVLRYYAGMPDEEIGEHVGAPVTTVRSVAARALARIRAHVSEHSEELT